MHYDEKYSWEKQCTELVDIIFTKAQGSSAAKVESELNELSLAYAKKSVKTREETADWYYAGSKDLSS